LLILYLIATELRDLIGPLARVYKSYALKNRDFLTVSASLRLVALVGVVEGLILLNW
jgi:hypothetical protein